MEICLEILQLKGDEFAGALKAASTVEIISKIQHLEMLITSSFKEGRPLYHPMQTGAEVTQGMCELQIALIEELKRRQAKREPGFANQEVCAALKPLIISTAATMVTALVGKCGEYAKPGKEWCIFKHDSKNPKKRAEKQPKGWPKHYGTKEEADKALKMMHTFGSAVDHGNVVKEYKIEDVECKIFKDSSGHFGALVSFPDGKERSNGMDFPSQDKAEEYANQAAKAGPQAHAAHNDAQVTNLLGKLHNALKEASSLAMDYNAYLVKQGIQTLESPGDRKLQDEIQAMLDNIAKIV